MSLTPGRTGKVGRMTPLVSTALCNGAGMAKILKKIGKATQQLYSPRSYDEQDYRVAFLLWKFGGARAARIGNKALNLPSLTTTWRHGIIPALRVSAKFPTISEVKENIRAQFPPSLFGSQDRPVGLVLLVDEIAVEQRLRHDPKYNTILGLCREHSGGYSAQFDSMDDANCLLEGFCNDGLHLASEVLTYFLVCLPMMLISHQATIIALGALTPQPRLRTAWAIMVSGTCKREPARPHANLLRTALDACQSEADITNGRVYSVASDGEAKRGLALTYLTLKRPLAENSPIYPHLGQLTFFNTLCGNDDLMADKDYKHMFKQLRNVLLHAKGVKVRNIVITASIIRQHLLDNKWPASRVASLLDPNGKQDIVLALSLLVAVWKLPSPADTDPPSTVNLAVQSTCSAKSAHFLSNHIPLLHRTSRSN
jgi:hypothetical protein